MKQDNQKVIYLHDSTCKGLHCFRGGFWDSDWNYYSTTSWACWDCGKPLGELRIPRYRLDEGLT
jgi:hypothetical protein